jgi:ligand-binding SRPBCC domain-containing protein
MNKQFTLERTQTIDRPVDEVFEFFSEAGNLTLITPDWLNFRIMSGQPVEMGVGAIIDYRLKLHGIPLRWRSEITEWDPPVRFVDEQRRGPYRYWIHEHSFEAVEAGRTVVRDRVRYAVPGGPLVNRLFVEPDLERVFRYRADKLDRIFHGERKVAG